MPLIIPPGYGQMSLNFLHNASTRSWSVTLGLDLSAAGGDFLGALQEATTAFRQDDGPMELMDSSVQLTTSTLTVGTDGGDPVFVEHTWNEPGGRALEAAPANTAALVRKSTALGGRRGRGRMYWPAVIGDAEISDIGVLDSTLVTGLTSRFLFAFNSLMTGLGGSPTPTPPVVLHHSEGEGVEPLPTPVTGFAVQALAATQRRRMRR